jgi:hypothetical protein
MSNYLIYVDNGEGAAVYYTTIMASSFEEAEAIAMTLEAEVDAETIIY